MNAAQRAGLSDAALALTDPIIEDLIRSICRRIREAGGITDTAEYEIYRAQALGAAKKDISRAVAKQLKIQQPVIDALFEYVLDNTLAYEDNGSLQQIAEAYARMTKDKTEEQLQSLWAQTPEGEVVPLQDAYARSMDYAFRTVATGAVDHETAIRRAASGLAARGLRTIEQKSGRSVGIEYAIRRYLMDQLGSLDDEVTQANHDALGCDGWEISAHAGSAPDHEPYQGRQYNDADYKALNEKLQRRIGHLNCGHTASPIILGVNSPQYTEAELQEMKEKNQSGVTYQGRHYTLYEAGQKQSSFENGIRDIRRRIVAAEETGDSKLESLRIRLQANRAVWTYRKAANSLHDSGATLYPVTKESIDAVPKPFFDGLSNNMNSKAQQLGKELLGKVFGKPVGTEAAVAFTVDGKKTLWEIGDDAATRVQRPHLDAPFYALHNHASNDILSPGDILALIRDDKMRGVGAVGHKGALFTCEKSFSFNKERAEAFFKELGSDYPAYRKDLAQQQAFLEAFMKEAANYGFTFKE